MGDALEGHKPHSAEYFGDTRDHWWNKDFLRLMSERWALDVVGDVLDVGCGVGHWGMLLASVMRDDVRVTGIDREPTWVEQATVRARERGLAGRFSYRQGEAQRLPFPMTRSISRRARPCSSTCPIPPPCSRRWCA
jgi:2-polyprenyl-3-methyl-5-hydroxy-6-metoxy-1,4-benzoquinol methylase